MYCVHFYILSSCVVLPWQRCVYLFWMYYFHTLWLQVCVDYTHVYQVLNECDRMLKYNIKGNNLRSVHK
jgi:hypothetical protein